MKRCLSPICGLPNDDSAIVCKFCKSKSFVSVPDTAPLRQVSEIGLLTREHVRSKPEVNLGPEIEFKEHSAAVQPSPENTPRTEPKPTNDVRTPMIRPPRSKGLRWIKTQFNEHLQRSLAIIGLLLAIIALPPVIYLWDVVTNHRPMIRTIKPSSNTILIGEDVTLTALAADPDGDFLEYEWTQSAGRITGTGADVILSTAGLDRRSAPPQINVTLTVRDRRDLESVPYSLPIRISTTKPRLRAIEVDRMELRVGEPVKLIAVADDPGGERAGKLHYEWNCPVGQIDRSDYYKTTLQTTGLNIRSAPIFPKVSLIVKNDRGESVEGEITLSITPAPRRRVIVRVAKPIGSESSGSQKSPTPVQPTPQAVPKLEEPKPPDSSTKVPE